MHTSYSICIIISYLTTYVQASSHHYQHKRGTLPISVSCVELLGDVHSTTTYVKRDLGFPGQIGPNILLTYGDTMYSDAKYSDLWRGMTSDSVALATHDPIKVLDVNLCEVNNQSFPDQFCPLLAEYGEDPSCWSCGITNVIETAPGQGILYYLLNNRPDGKNNLIGAGIATISVSDTYPPIPSLTRLPGQQYWWDASCEPWYGDVGSIYASDGYIYAYGHAQDLPWVYLTRVPLQNATSLSFYEYWNGENWQSERLYDMGEKEGVFWQIKYAPNCKNHTGEFTDPRRSQGQVVWSAYYSCYLFVYCDNWMDNKVLAMTAQKPEGPWSEAVTLYQATPITAGSSIYAAVPHPYYDVTGRTLVVTFTNHPNCIQAIKIVSQGVQISELNTDMK